DEEAGRYVVKGSYGEDNTVTIGYDPEKHTVRVIDEVSPQNICQKQGETNSPLKPLTCLPNEVVIRIETPLPDPDTDDGTV
ncbi:MAG: NusG domain II-containing protein, partial [Bacillota bacterium]